MTSATKKSVATGWDDHSLFVITSRIKVRRGDTLTPCRPTLIRRIVAPRKFSQEHCFSVQTRPVTIKTKRNGSWWRYTNVAAKAATNVSNNSEDEEQRQWGEQAKRTLNMWARENEE